MVCLKAQEGFAVKASKAWSSSEVAGKPCMAGVSAQTIACLCVAAVDCQCHTLVEVRDALRRLTICPDAVHGLG